MLAGAKAAGLKTLLVSGGFTFFTEKLKARLGLDFTRANTLEIVDGKLTGKVIGEIVNAEVKARTLRETCAQLGIEPTPRDCDGRRLERSENDGRGGTIRRVSREAGGARSGQRGVQPRWAGWVVAVVLRCHSTVMTDFSTPMPWRTRLSEARAGTTAHTPEARCVH